MRGSNCYCRLVSWHPRSQQQRGRVRLGKPPKVDGDDVGDGGGGAHTILQERAAKKQRQKQQQQQRGEEAATKGKAGAHVQVARAGEWGLLCDGRYEYRTCPPRYHATASLCSFLGTVDHRPSLALYLHLHGQTYLPTKVGN